MAHAVVLKKFFTLNRSSSIVGAKYISYGFLYANSSRHDAGDVKPVKQTYCTSPKPQESPPGLLLVGTKLRPANLQVTSSRVYCTDETVSKPNQKPLSTGIDQVSESDWRKSQERERREKPLSTGIEQVHVPREQKPQERSRLPEGILHRVERLISAKDSRGNQQKALSDKQLKKLNSVIDALSAIFTKQNGRSRENVIALIKCIEYVHELHSKQQLEDGPVEKLEGLLLGNHEKFSPLDLIWVQQIYESRQEKANQKELYDAVTETLHSKEDNFTFKIHNVRSWFRYWHKLPANWKRLYEKALLERIEDFHDPRQIVLILKELGVFRRRFTGVIYALLAKLQLLGLENLSPMDLATVVHSCSVLNIYEPVFFGSVCMTMEPQIAQIGDKDRIKYASTYLYSFGILRWRNTLILDKLTEQALTKPLPSLSKTLLLTCSSLNYLPAQLKDDWSTVLNLLEKSKKGYRHQWVMVVWSATILQQLTSSLAESVFAPTFLNSVCPQDITESETVKNSLLFRLLDIHFAATTILSDYQGPRLPDNLVEKIRNLKKPKEETLFFKRVNSAFWTVVNEEKGFVRKHVQTPSGHFIDFEVKMSEEGEFLKLDEEGAKEEEKESRTEEEQLSEEVEEKVSGKEEEKVSGKKVAVKLLDFGEVLEGGVLNGHQQLIHDIVKASGYTVVSIPYIEYPMEQRKAGQARYLKNKMLSALGLPPDLGSDLNLRHPYTDLKRDEN